MAKGALVSYAGYPYTLSSLFPDNGLASLAAVLRGEGHECVVLDYNTAASIGRLVDAESHATLKQIYPRIQGPPDPEVVQQLQAVARRVEANGVQVADEIAGKLIQRCKRDRLDFVGFKLWNGDGFDASVHMANRIRDACPRVRLLAGGPSVHHCGHTVPAEAPVFDAVVDGDGEEAILELARWVENRRPREGIPNLVSRDSSCGTRTETDLATLPVPEYGPSAYPSVHEGGKLNVFSIDDSRGCPMRCAFCINWCIEGGRWRTRSAQQVVEEVKGYVARFRSRAFRLAGTYSPPGLLREICARIGAEGLEVRFGVSLCAAGADADLLSVLRAAGCTGVFVGVESGNDTILRRGMEKPVRAAKQREVLEASLNQGIFTVGSFIFPAPFETAVTEADTRALIKEVFAGRPNGAVMLVFPGLMPRTRWWTDRSRFGFEVDVDEETYRSVFLRYKITHLLPPTLWDELPYRLNGVSQTDLARRNSDLQSWVHRLGVAVNLSDHDAEIGASLGHKPQEFQRLLRRHLFTGDSDGMLSLVEVANKNLEP
jgi:hypothetical protein